MLIPQLPILDKKWRHSKQYNETKMEIENLSSCDIKIFFANVVALLIPTFWWYMSVSFICRVPRCVGRWVLLLSPQTAVRLWNIKNKMQWRRWRTSCHQQPTMPLYNTCVHIRLWCYNWQGQHICMDGYEGSGRRGYINDTSIIPHMESLR